MPGDSYAYRRLHSTTLGTYKGNLYLGKTLKHHHSSSGIGYQ